jgi:hypothetical protein
MRTRGSVLAPAVTMQIASIGLHKTVGHRFDGRTWCLALVL